MTRKILVTGGAGNIGGSLARRLVTDRDNYLCVVDDLSTGRPDKLPSRDYKNWRFVRADVNCLADLTAIMCSDRFDYVFHYAAIVGVQRTLSNPRLVLGDIDGIKNILDLAKNTGVKRVFYSSSSEVYGEPFEFPQREDTTPLNSRLPYAIVKNVGEAFFKSYYREYDLAYTIFRFFNTFGPLQSSDFVISRFVVQALAGEPLTIYGDGTQTRTFCYIDDNLEFTQKVLYGDLARNETINVGSDCEIQIGELAELVIDLVDGKSRLSYLPPLPEGDMTRRCPDISRMKSILGRDPAPLREGLERTIRFLREQRA